MVMRAIQTTQLKLQSLKQQCALGHEYGLLGWASAGALFCQVCLCLLGRKLRTAGLGICVLARQLGGEEAMAWL